MQPSKSATDRLAAEDLSPRDARLLQALERGLIAVGGILRKLSAQLQPFGLIQGYTTELRELEAALAALRELRQPGEPT